MFENLVHEFGTLKKKEAKPQKQILDDATSTEDIEDGMTNNIAVFQEQSIANEALNNFSEWLETSDDDLDEGEGLGDRLFALMVGVADANKDGEIDEDEADVINIALNAVYDYLVSKGVSDDNATSLLENFDNDLAETIRGFVIEKLPEGDSALSDEFDKVVFSSSDNESIFDSAEEIEKCFLDAAYRKKIAIRNGKKVRINKRISGVVKLTAKQKQALRKAQRKATSSAAKMKRIKSFKIRRRMGI